MVQDGHDPLSCKSLAMTALASTNVSVVRKIPFVVARLCNVLQWQIKE